MRIDDMVLIGIDDHVVEPRDMFDQHVPERYRDEAPKVVANEQSSRVTSSATTRSCYVSDPVALKVRSDIGTDIIAWECDYAHSDSTWPDAPEAITREMEGAGAIDEEIHKITWENSARHFRFDPFR